MKTQRATLLLIVLVVALVGPLRAAVTLPQIFSNGMVLQRQMKVPVWGWGEDGETVTVVFNGQTKATVVKGGEWRVDLEPLVAGGPFEMTVKGTNTLTVEDVLVGEVWFTCGQSNMLMGLGSATGGDAFFQKYQAMPKGRLRIVNQSGPAVCQSPTIKKDVAARWQQPSIGYSAVSYAFAHKLYEYLDGEVPVGVVTYTEIVPAECWVDAGRIAAHPNLAGLINHPLKVTSKGYNGTIAPLTPFAIRGVIYYQAEYNGGRDLEFRDLFPALIASWREAWERPDLPFLFVQLPGFLYHAAGQDAKIDMDAATLAQHRALAKYQWVGMRDAQRWIWQNTPNTGLASAVDLGEKYDIHPKNKLPIGDRLLVSARKVAYGEKIVDSGPWPAAVAFKGDRIAISYDYVGGGLVAKDGELTGFEIAGADNQYVPATAMIVGEQVMVSSPRVKEPIHLRYAWAGFPECSLYNREGLPALPFRHSLPGKTIYPATAQFSVHNPSFEKQAAGGPTDWGTFSGDLAGTVESADQASAGEASVRLLPGGRIYQKNLADGVGHYWNADPSRPHFLRPGCLAGYTVDLAAAGPAGEVATLYMNMCATETAGGYQAWGGIRHISTASAAFVPRPMVHRMTDTDLPAYGNWGNSAGGRWLNQSKQVAALLDNFSAVQIVRPLLKVSTTGPIGLTGHQLSPAVVITNAQTKTLPELLTDDAEPQEVSTLLYGCASFAPDARGLMQTVVEPTDHVGVVLIGKDADRFELVGDQIGEDGRTVRLVGEDGKPGLAGGETPETETFAVRLKASSTPGRYRASVRIVTQAANIGAIATGKSGQPPVNFHYVDIPITAEP